MSQKFKRCKYLTRNNGLFKEKNRHNGKIIFLSKEIGR